MSLMRTIFLLVTMWLPLSAFGAALIVCADYPTIQAAVDAAQPGDTILIQPGTYREIVTIGPGRAGLEIGAETVSTEVPPVILQAPHLGDEVLRVVHVEGVQISDLQIREGRVRVEDAPHLTAVGLWIRGRVRWRRDGVAPAELSTTRDPSRCGLRIDDSPHLVLESNTIEYFPYDGICIRNSRTARLRTNTAKRNGGCGIRVEGVSSHRHETDLTAAYNMATENRHGAFCVLP